MKLSYEIVNQVLVITAEGKRQVVTRQIPLSSVLGMDTLVAIRACENDRELRNVLSAAIKPAKG